MWLPDQLIQGLFWSAATIGFYVLARVIHRRRPRWWNAPLALAPALLLTLALSLHEGYRDYIRGTYWLVLMAGPAMVAFAVPIYEQRALICRQWPALAVGVCTGSAIALVTAWVLAEAVGLPAQVRLSLLPRSLSTPFAMALSGDIGGMPELTAMFVNLTGLMGASLGLLLLRWLPLRSKMAQGILFGMGAHGVGVATAHKLGAEQGSIAGLAMMLAGLLNVLAAPLLAFCLQYLQ